mmetsp:Transcript_33766/g.89802  ORF Transcript_33766/g.89802 Transcript_33766/m.89802 type:complete len:289 (+) Transcript_33766:509-1375(+)
MLVRGGQPRGSRRPNGDDVGGTLCDFRSPSRREQHLHLHQPPGLGGPILAHEDALEVRAEGLLILVFGDDVQATLEPLVELAGVLEEPPDLLVDRILADELAERLRRGHDDAVQSVEVRLPHLLGKRLRRIPGFVLLDRIHLLLQAHLRQAHLRQAHLRRAGFVIGVADLLRERLWDGMVLQVPHALLLLLLDPLLDLDRHVRWLVLSLRELVDAEHIAGLPAQARRPHMEDLAGHPDAKCVAQRHMHDLAHAIASGLQLYLYLLSLFRVHIAQHFGAHRLKVPRQVV